MECESLVARRVHRSCTSGTLCDLCLVQRLSQLLFVTEQSARACIFFVQVMMQPKTIIRSMSQWYRGQTVVDGGDSTTPHVRRTWCADGHLQTPNAQDRLRFTQDFVDFLVSHWPVHGFWDGQVFWDARKVQVTKCVLELQEVTRTTF